MSPRPIWSSVRSVLSVVCSSSRLPFTVVQAISSRSGCSAANMMATASSVPVSTSRISFRLGIVCLAIIRIFHKPCCETDSLDSVLRRHRLDQRDCEIQVGKSARKRRARLFLLKDAIREVLPFAAERRIRNAGNDPLRGPVNQRLAEPDKRGGVAPIGILEFDSDLVSVAVHVEPFVPPFVMSDADIKHARNV